MDELTGAYLRRPSLLQLERDLSRVRRCGEPLVVAFGDVDGLKASTTRAVMPLGTGCCTAWLGRCRLNSCRAT